MRLHHARSAKLACPLLEKFSIDFENEEFENPWSGLKPLVHRAPCHGEIRW